MDLETFREYCLTKIPPESMPFGEGVLVFKVAGKCLRSLLGGTVAAATPQRVGKRSWGFALRFCRLRPARIAGSFSAIACMHLREFIVSRSFPATGN
jgi:hypothetical protein